MPDDTLIRITTENAEQSERAIRRVEEALADLEAQVEVVESKTSELGETEKTLGEKVDSLTKKIGHQIAAHVAFAAALKGAERGVRALTASNTALATQVGVLNAKIGAAHAGVVSFTRTALFALRAGLIGVAVAISARLLVQMGRWLDTMGAAGAALVVTKQGFDNLAKSIGETGDALETRLRIATLGTVDNFRLLQVGTRALLTDIAATGAELQEMAKLSTILALAVGKDAAEGFDILTTGIARHSTMLLKQLGIVVDTNQAYRDYARELDITTDQLNAHQRAIAFTNETMEVARRNVDRLALDTNNLAVINAQAVTSAQNLKQAFQEEIAASKQLIEFKKELLWLTILLRSQTEEGAPAIGVLTESYFLQARALFDVITKGESYNFVFGVKLVEMIRDAREEVEKFNVAIGDIRVLTSQELGYPPRPARPLTPGAIQRRLDPVRAERGVFVGQPRISELILDELAILEKEVGPAMREIADRITETLTESTADFFARQGAVFQEHLRPAMEAIGERAMMSAAEVRALADEFLAFDLSTTEAVEALREFGNVTDVDLRRVLNLFDELRERTSETAVVINQQWAAAMQGIVIAVFEGAQGIEVAFRGLINTLARIVEQEVIAAKGGGVLGSIVGGLAGGIVGGLGGLIVGSLIDTSSRRPIPVTVTEVQRPIRLDRTGESDPSVVVQILDPSSGRILEQFVAQSRRMESRGGTIRLPRPFIAD